MEKCAFCNADGDFLVVPQQGSYGSYRVCGKLQVFWRSNIPPYGFVFSVDLSDCPSRGYIAEVLVHSQLLDLGP
ncbi:homogentisate 1,2-dioxygenase [Tanacetum coccineum]